jgi:hypothetical protein
MMHDHVEFSALKQRSPRRSRRVASRRRSLSQGQRNAAVQPVDAIDEAFAGFTRVDAGSSRADVRCMESHLVATLSAQLRALDQQREQLSKLLQSVDDLPVK